MFARFFMEKIALGGFFFAGVFLFFSVANGSENSPENENFGEDCLIETENFPTIQTEIFSVSAETTQAVNRAATLAREDESYFFRAQKTWNSFLKEPIRRADIEFFSDKNIFKISADGDGSLILFLGENFSGDAFLTRARLAEIVLRQQNPAGVRSVVPAWICAAIAEESRIGTVPGRRIFLQKKSKSRGPVSPEILLGASLEKFEKDETLRINALWLLRSATNVAAFFDEKKSTSEKFASAFPRKFSTDDNLEKFWATQFFAQISRAPAGIDLMEESRLVLDDALLISVREGKKETRVLAVDLIAVRGNEEIRKCVAENFAALAPSFGKINPVWHNALTEFGVFLEMFGDPDISDESLFAQWEKTIFARKQALALQKEVSETLRRAQKKRPREN